MNLLLATTTHRWPFSVGHLNESETDTSLLGESTLDFQLLMGLLGRKQEVLLYQISDDTGLFFGMVDAYLHKLWNSSMFLPSDKLLAAMDGTYCSVAGVHELGMHVAGVPCCRFSCLLTRLS